MAKEADSTPTTRRNLIRLATAAAATAAGSIPAIALADPIYDAIERHRETIRAWDAASAEVSRLQADWFAQRKDPFEEPPGTAIADAEGRQDALGDREKDAADELVETIPTTIAGALAAIRYVLGYYDGDSDLYPGSPHELLDDEQTLTFLATLGDGIEAIAATAGR